MLSTSLDSNFLPMTSPGKPLPFTVLLADDSGTIRRYVSSILEASHNGCKVIECEHGGYALQWLSSRLDEEFPDLIILDRNMPIVSGDECVRMLKLNSGWQHIPVLFLTAQSDSDHIYEAKNGLGVDGYICKPFEPDELLREVHTLTNKISDRLESDEDHRWVGKDARAALTDQHSQQIIDESIVPLFLEEAKELIDKINSELDAAKVDCVGASTWRSIAYCAHTIKGSAGIVGLESHSRLGKALEDYSQEVIQQPDLFQAKHIESLEEVVSLLTDLTEADSVHSAQACPGHLERVEALEIVLAQLISSTNSATSDNAESGQPKIRETLQNSGIETNAEVSISEIKAEGSSHSLALGPADKKEIVVLLIDDQKLVGETVRRMLVDQASIEFHFCKNPLDAIEAAINIQPTVILQDLVMPQLDGLELVRHFRAEPALRDVPLIVLSGTEDAKTKAKAFALGANDYMVKLPDQVEVIARIRYHSRGYLNLLEREAHLERITWLAEHDPLTGCLNRRTWYEQLVQTSGVISDQENLAVAICDIDFFKKINDTYGHLCGDEALKHFVSVLQEKLEGLGVLGRWGGEEFAIFMVLPSPPSEPLEPLEGACTVLETMRGSIQDAPITWEAQIVHMTMSVGTALYNRADSVGAVLARADEGVYQAKESGRNKVVAIA